ncbi:hypothetical protein GGR56DRAFT_632364 [Xylariaceae sp. FL0804]|nr:hypothetical protein GGR56DRAFT_632364 [Xylariaceae sp. FL0804]
MTLSPVKSVEDAAAAAAVVEPAFPPAATSSQAGLKRPAPSLLPPFEPLSSSPGLPRPLKRQARNGSLGSSAFLKYPTPVPTSSTGILSSSPPRLQPAQSGLIHNQSSVPERAPLSAVASVELNGNGEMLIMGRSSNSSHYQLTANRLVSRVHVKARYMPASNPFDPNKVEIICNGWNGLKLHCQGRTWELSKGDTFTSETEGAEIMLDVQDARVMVHWPRREHHDSDSSWEGSPRGRARPSASALELLQSSPLGRHPRVQTPESPTPCMRSAVPKLDDHLDAGDDSEPVQIYEDASADEQELPETHPEADASFAQTVVAPSFSSDLSDPEEDEEEDNPDEENDPIIHSFGPFGADLSNRMAAVTAVSPKRPSRVQSGDTTAKGSEEPGEDSEEEPFSPDTDVAGIRNHVVNQLAYSRLQSTPLTTIMKNLPVGETKDLTKVQMRRIIESTLCIGTIARQGKDAAGKPLESEYYYVPENDTDDSRRLAVTDGLRKPSLRACRKQHKQYYWKRPRTP